MKKKITIFFARGILTIFCLYAFNVLLATKGFHIPLNAFTTLTGATLGIPGILAIFALQIVQ